MLLTEEELEAEREAQMAKSETPHYSGKCRHLTAEEQTKLRSRRKKTKYSLSCSSRKVYTFNDMVKDEVSFESDGIGDWVIVKKDGIPTYNFAVAIDDHLMEISHVLTWRRSYF